MMQAILQNAPGGADTLYVGEAARPAARAGSLLVRVMAAGVNRADIVQREGHYPPPPGASELLGLEIAGVVEEVVGPSRFRPGDAVFGLVGGGAYAEYALLEEELAIPKPDWLSWAEAASLPEAWMTAWLNLVRVAHLDEGETLLVHAGASGVGITAIQLAGMLGAKAIASAGSAVKLDYCRAHGAAEAFNYRETPAFSALLKQWGGVDVILDPVGASHFNENVAGLNKDGRLVLIGVMGGTRAEINLGQMLMRRLTVCGSTLRTQPLEVKAELARALEQYVLPALEQGLARLTLDSSYPWQLAADAHAHIEANANLGKVVLTFFPVMSAQ
ncbi:NAD(P)H-quinone oxidoreductase [uncultured Aquitalea sp.]|uniref:NAD(P)H-quinone oxidoreductase n=1 Tax=uncultured Aquitalea sp. TaxID=540272 RepID=UPI0025EB2489|nr:NAD(P)H-quinone oxidoreductase [uncultured Aquitalea sp.]